MTIQRTVIVGPPKMAIRTVEDARDLKPGDGTVYVRCAQGGELSPPEFEHLDRLGATYIRMAFTTGLYYQISL